MARTPVNWNPNRYGSVKHVLKFDAATGTYSLEEQEQNYNNTYNFASLPSNNTQTSTNATQQTGTTTQQTGTTTQAQTAEAFGDVKPYYWNQGGGDEGNQNQEITKTSTKEQPQLSGFFNPLDKAISGKPVGSLGTILKQKFENIGGKFSKTERDWADVDRDIEIDRINAELAKGGLDYEEEAALRNELSELQKQSTTGFSSFFTKPKDLAKKTYEKTGLKKAVDFLKPFPLKVADAMASPVQRSRNSFNKIYFSQKNGIYENGRIAGDPNKSVFAGMNAESMFGNPAKSAADRITKRNKTIATKNVSKEFIQNTKDMEKELNNYNKDHNNHNISEYSKDKAKTQGTIQQLNPHEMRNVAETGDAGGGKGGKSIICTQMYQQTQLEDWKKTMRLWYIFQKKYLTMEHQEGYHFLFKPFVNGMKKSKVLTALGKHCAIARTNDIKHIMFGTPFSLSGRLVRLVTEPICYITGKIKSWL